MRFLFRAIFFGILTGAFLFFFPLHFFFFPIIGLFLLLRLFFRPWRWRHRFYGSGPYGGHRFAGYAPMNNDEDIASVVPIDGFGRGYRSRGQEGVHNINIQ